MFQAASPPVAARAASMICGQAGAPACGAAPSLGAPALAAPEVFRASDGTMAIVLHGGGAAPGATLTVFEVKSDGTLADARIAHPVHLRRGACSRARPLTVQRRKYVLVAKQSLDGQDSALSEQLFVEVRIPSGRLRRRWRPPRVAADGTVTVGGTAGGSTASR